MNKKQEKWIQINSKITFIKSQPACCYQLASGCHPAFISPPKCWNPFWYLPFFLLFNLLLFWKKIMFKCLKRWFHQSMAYKSPVCWLKYTTLSFIINCLALCNEKLPVVIISLIQFQINFSLVFWRIGESWVVTHFVNDGLKIIKILFIIIKVRRSKTR